MISMQRRLAPSFHHLGPPVQRSARDLRLIPLNCRDAESTWRLASRGVSSPLRPSSTDAQKKARASACTTLEHSRFGPCRRPARTSLSEPCFQKGPHAPPPRDTASEQEVLLGDVFFYLVLPQCLYRL